MFLVGESAALLMYYSKPCGADLNRKHCSPSLYWNEETGVYFLTIKTCELKLQHEDPWPLETNTLQIWGLREAAGGILGSGDSPAATAVESQDV